jgi:hypothetical protein
MVERSHRQLKDSLRARLAGPDWPSHLPWVLLGLHAAPKEDTNISSAELVFGVPLALPGELLPSSELPIQAFLHRLRSCPAPPATRPLMYAQATASVPSSLFTAPFVYIRTGGASSPLAPVYQGPYRVRQRNAKFFPLEVGDRLEAVSVDCLKPHLGPTVVQPAGPPPRGRPHGPNPVSPASTPS